MFVVECCWSMNDMYASFLTSTYLHKIQTRATKMVYGVEPDLTREGGSIPVTLTLQVILFWKWLWCWLLIADYENDDNSHCSDDKLRLFRRQLERMWSCCRWVPLMMELTLRTRRLTSGVVGGSISCSVKTSCWWRGFGLKVCLGGWGFWRGNKWKLSRT